MAFSITPSLGANLNFVGALPYYDSNNGIVSPQLGAVVKGNDGHDYIWARASAAIASAAVVILTEPAMTMATGAGAWTAPAITGGVPINNCAWFKKTII